MNWKNKGEISECASSQEVGSSQREMSNPAPSIGEVALEEAKIAPVDVIQEEEKERNLCTGQVLFNFKHERLIEVEEDEK